MTLSFDQLAPLEQTLIPSPVSRCSKYKLDKSTLCADFSENCLHYLT